MTTMAAYFWLAALGLVVGSFLNVVIYRYNTGRSALRGRSACAVCAVSLSWFELVPVFSFIAQVGRCRHCLSRISWQYPAVELLTAALFLASGWQIGLAPAEWPWLGLRLAIISLLVVILVYDWRHKIIPDGLAFAFAALSLVPALASGDWLIVREHLLAGFSLFLFFYLLWRLSAGRWMGLGDGKLALGVGFLLGATGGWSAIVFAFWLGALVGVGLILASGWRRRAGSFTMKSEIPFAPFIIFGLWLNLFLQLNVLSVFKIF